MTDVFNPGGRFGPFPGGSRGKSGMEKKARDKGDGEGDFLGGVRSPRPDGKAGGEPGRVMIAGDKRRTEGPGETCRGEVISVPLGRAEPAPPRRGRADGVRP